MGYIGEIILMILIMSVLIPLLVLIDITIRGLISIYKARKTIGKIHPAQVFIDKKALEDSNNMELKIELDELRKLNKRRPYTRLDKEPIMSSTSNETYNIDGMDYSAAQIILGASDYMSDTDSSPNHSTYEGNGHGGDFGGGGASGSWDSGSSDSSSWND